MEGISVSIKYRFAFAVRLIDSYTGGAPIGSGISVTLVGERKKPIAKPDGLYVFSDLPAGPYQVAVSAPHYVAETVDVVVAEGSDLVVTVPLAPSPAYPFLEGATLIRATIRDALNRPVTHCPVQAVVLSEECAKGKLLQEAQKGEQQLSIVQVLGRVRAGDRYLLKGKKASASETCLLSHAVEDAPAVYQLGVPLRYAYPRGAWLFPVIASRTDERGDVVLPLGNYRSKAFDLRLEFGEGEQTTLKEVSVQAGEMTGLGVVRIG